DHGGGGGGEAVREARTGGPQRLAAGGARGARRAGVRGDRRGQRPTPPGRARRDSIRGGRPCRARRPAGAVRARRRGGLRRRGGGEVVAARAEPRKAFYGRSGVRRNLRWDPLDATYFAGYAMWNYLCFPLLLTRPGVKAREVEPWRELRRLEVEFPRELDTHS